MYRHNTIVTVSLLHMCWVKYVDSGVRRGTPFVAQTTARNAIHTILDQGKKQDLSPHLSAL